jgi:hypothetical protein
MSAAISGNPVPSRFAHAGYKLPHVPDAPAVAAEGAGHRGVVAAYVGEAIFSVEIGITLSSIAMEKLFNRIDMIGIRWCTRGLEIHPGKTDRGVAPDVDAKLRGNDGCSGATHCVALASPAA